MKLVLAVDGSEFTQKALDFLVAHESLVGPGGDLLVLNVQPALPNTVSHVVGPAAIKDFHHDEANKVLDPIKLFLDRHALRYRCEWRVGAAAVEIVAAARREKCDLIVMGTRGLGLVGSLLMGSVTQRVVANGEVPVLLIQ
jgi:nucleotide-binding universal stress UspA family protein